MDQVSEHFPDNFYRVTIKGLCVDKGKLLMVREDDRMGGAWELPGGGLDFDEDIRTGFEREIAEEMGLTVAYMAETPMYVWTHKLTHLRDMEWFYTLVLAYRVVFDHFDFSSTEECRELGWFTKEELYDLRLCRQTTKLPDVFEPDHFS